METILEFTLIGDPRTKKNSSRFAFNKATGKRILIPSEPYKEYENNCLMQLTGKQKIGINRPINLECRYYLKTKRKCDLVNLLQASCDILAKANVITDDNFKIVESMDGSRVYYDKENPRVEIKITSK